MGTSEEEAFAKAPPATSSPGQNSTSLRAQAPDLARDMTHTSARNRHFLVSQAPRKDASS